MMVTPRFLGAALIALGALAILRLHGLVTALPRRQPTLAEMLLSLAAILAGVGGALMLREGRSLFEDQPWPPHSPRR
jgi:hypothetical protein